MKLKDKIILTIARFTRKHSFKGMQRTLNFIFPPSNENKISTVIDDYNGDLKINIDTSSFLEWFIFFKGDYESDVIKLIKKILKPRSIAIDVGANIGLHTLIMRKMVGDNGKVFAVEPHPKIIEKLKKNINLNNFENIEIINLAISNTSETADFYLYDEKSSNEGTSSLYNRNVTEPLSSIKVKIDTLDKIVSQKDIKRLDLIKIDTEGNDFNVLKGAEKTIRNHKPFIIFEYEKTVGI